MSIDGPDFEDDELTDSVPRVVPAYADAELKDLGERLAALYATRDAEPTAPVADEIARIRGKMRRGPRLHAGEFLQDGRYRLLERLQRGTGDACWKALDRTSGELVFVRVFHGEWVDDKPAVEAFVERGDRLEQLKHASIGRVLDAAVSDDGFVYLATELFEGGDLESAKPDAIDAIQVGVEIAQALGHAHAQGVVHGDLRPSNVMLAPDGGARLVGFSVGPAGPQDLASLFRAPETTERGYVPAPPADVYALGMTVLQTLNGGELPFWVLRDPARLIRGLPVSDGVKGVIQRATDWDLQARYPDTRALLDELLADPELLAALAERAQQRGRFAVAAEHGEALLKLQPNRAVEIRRTLGDLYTQMGAYDRAFVHLLAALERTPDVEALFEPLRVVAARTGDWARLAEALWTQARARDAGRRVVLRMELARINQEELGNAMAAAETWSQVLADHRTPAQAATALQALQALARARGDWAGFVEYGQELLEFLPEDVRAPVEYAIGRAYLEHLEDEDRGLEHIDRAEERGYTEPDLGLRLQGIRARRGQWQRVIHLMVQQAHAQEIAEASPTLLRAGIIASSVHLEEEAFKVYHALLERAPRHVVALRHLARLHHRAHEHDKALKYYERLWDTYRGKDSEEPEASERAADCCAYALILLKRGRTDDATERLDEALRLNANHVPSLQLSGPLFLGKGDTARAGLVFDRLLSLFKSVELSPQKIEACVGMGDLAWVQGRLTAAMGWYNRALELDPFSVTGWWGLSKVALASRGGHPGADRAPWVMAMPKRYTGHEALARLVCGLVTPDAMRAWLSLTPLGRAMLEGGDTTVRMACAVVDVMARNEVIAPDLFERLGDASPEWAEPVEEVERLWFGGGASTFPVARSYGWTRAVLDHDLAASRSSAGDFDPLAVRAVLPTELAPPPVAVEALKTADAWRTLLSGALPPPPEPFTMIEPREDSGPVRYEGPVGALVRDGALWLALLQEQCEVTVGSAPRSTLRLADDPTIRERHARLYRLGARVYLEALSADGRVQVDGEDRQTWRLVGGERVTLGETRLQYQAFDDASRLPPPARIAAIGWMEDLHTGTLAAEPEEEPAEPLPPVPAPEPEPAPEPVTVPLDAPEPAAPEPVVAEPAPSPPPIDARPPAIDASPPAVPPAIDERPAAVPPADRDPDVEPTVEKPPPPAAPELAEVPMPPPVDARSPSVPPAVSLPPVTPDPGPSETDELGMDPPSEEEVVEPTIGRHPPPVSVPPAVDVDEEALSEDSGSLMPIRATPAPAPVAPAPDRSLLDERPEEPPAKALEKHLANAPAWLRAALEAETGDKPLEPEYDPDEAPTVVAKAPLVPPPEPGPRPVDRDVFDFTEVRDPDDGLSRLDSAPKPLPKGVTGKPATDASLAGVPQVIPTVTRTPVPSIRSTNPFAPVHSPASVPPLPVIPGAGTPGSPPPRAAVPSGIQPMVPPPAAPPPAAPPAVPLPLPTPSMAPPPPLVRIRAASLEYMSGPDRGKRVSVGERLTVGQGANCGMSIPADTRLSPLHCTVERTRDGYLLVDSGSANGTVVNGQRVTEVGLAGGEVIMVGRTVLRFQLEDAE